MPSHLKLVSGHALSLARGAALKRFSLVALFSLAALSLPALVILWRNSKREKLFQAPLLVGKEFGFEHSMVGRVVSAIQVMLLLSAVLWFTFGPLGVGTIFTKSRLSPPQIQAIWRSFEEACKPSPPDLS